MTDTHPLMDTINSLPLQIASLPPATIATKTKEYAINASIAGIFALLRWGFKRGTFKPTKFTVPIYLVTGSAVGYYIWKYRQQAQTIIAKAQEGLTTPSTSA